MGKANSMLPLRSIGKKSGDDEEKALIWGANCSIGQNSVTSAQDGNREISSSNRARDITDISFKDENQVKMGLPLFVIDKITNPSDGNPALLIKDDRGGMDPDFTMLHELWIFQQTVRFFYWTVWKWLQDQHDATWGKCYCF